MATAETTELQPDEKADILQRMHSLETLVGDLNDKVMQLSSKSRDRKANWITRMWGCMSEFPEYDEVVRLGREARQAYQVPE